MVETYFFDTYALYEIIEGNDNYSKYTEKVGIVTTKLNLMELYYGLLKDYGQKIAEKYFGKLAEFCVDVDDDTIKTAMQLKKQRKKLSYVDCIGYTLAKQFSIPFLTGNKEFKEMENVEYRK